MPLNTRENNCKTIISVLDLIEEFRFLYSPQPALRRVVIKVLQCTLREEMLYWTQQGKIRTTIDGDENSHFFHASASARLHKYKINVLLPNGTKFFSH